MATGIEYPMNLIEQAVWIADMFEYRMRPHDVKGCRRPCKVSLGIYPIIDVEVLDHARIHVVLDIECLVGSALCYRSSGKLSTLTRSQFEHPRPIKVNSQLGREPRQCSFALGRIDHYPGVVAPLRK